MFGGDSGVIERSVGLADPGREIDTEALREIYFGVNRVIDDLVSDFRAEMEMEGDLVEVEIFVELHDRYASSAAAAIESLDLAWRLAWAATEIDPQELPSSGGMVDIDTLIPIVDAGLSIERVEVGSIRIWFKQNKGKIGRALAALSIASTVLGVNARDAVSLVAHRPDQTSCQVKAIGELDERPAALVRENLPGLAPDSLVKITIETPEGARLIAEVRVA